MGVTNPQTLQKVVIATYLHDLGMAMLNRKYLEKTVLNQKEYFEMISHTKHGGNILKTEMGINDPVMEGIMYNHHERLDGSGYPRRKKCLKIQERVVAIIDAFDEMTYKKSDVGEKSPGEAIQYMQKHMGAKLDMQVLNQFAYLLKKEGVLEQDSD